MTRDIRFTRLSLEQGLSQSVVNCVFQDSIGFLWFGTQVGLNRWDGYEFEVYRHDADDPHSLAHDWVVAITEDKSGDLWIATEGGGISRWQRESDSFTTYRHDAESPGSLSSDRVITLTIDHHGDLWIGTLDAGLNRLADAADRPASPDLAFENFRHDESDPASLSSDQTGAVYEDRDGNLWIGTWNGLDLLSDDERSFTHYRHDAADPGSLSDNRVRAVIEDGRRVLWVGTHRGLNRLDRESGRFRRFLHDPRDAFSLSNDWVRTLLEDREGRLWIGTDGGLHLWKDGRFARYHFDPDDPQSLGSDQIVHLYEDRGGVLWAGTLGGGAAKWDPSTWGFQTYQTAGGREGTGRLVFAISQDAAGDLWIGSFGGGLERLRRDASGQVVGRRRYVHDPDDLTSLGDDRVTALLHDRGGALWIGTVGGGLNHFDPITGRFRRFVNEPANPASLAVDAVTTLHEDRRGRLWVGVLDGGLHLHRGEGSFTRFQHAPDDSSSLAHDRVFSIAEDRRGRLWLATDGGGLDRFDTAGSTFQHFRHVTGVAASLSSDELLTVHIDPQERLWIGTKGHGVDLLVDLDAAPEEATFRNFSQSDGLAGDTIWGILSDPRGLVWLSTGNGLSRFDPASESFRNYDTSDGLQAREFNMGASHRGARGELFFGGVNGLNAFFPDRISGRRQAPPVVLTGLTTFNRPLDLDRPLFVADRIELAHDDRFLTFEFAALDFSAPEKNRYRYRLSDLDDTWVDLDYERRVTFPSLAPGNHRLQVQGSNSDGVWSRATSLEIRVAPPSWQSWWAQTLYAVMAMTAIWLFVHFQNRRIERERARVRERERHLSERERLISELELKNAELERFNYTVSHDLKSPLVTIKGFLGYLRRDLADGDAEHVEKDLQRISGAADRMSELLQDLLEFALLGRQVNLPESVALHELAYEARELLAATLGERSVELEIATDLPVVSGDRVRLRAVFQNLIENAVKYMSDQRAPRIEIGCRRNDDGEVVFVRDNGRGIEPRYHTKVFEIFERLDADNRGTGIGLALVKRIVELHGGRVWVESDGRNRGSTFCFTLGELQGAP